MTKGQGKEIIELKNQIQKQFTQSDWLELGYILGTSDIINDHPRLLRSLSFGDDDYEASVLQVLKKNIKKDPVNKKEIEKLIKIGRAIILFK